MIKLDTERLLIMISKKKHSKGYSQQKRYLIISRIGYRQRRNIDVTSSWIIHQISIAIMKLYHNSTTNTWIYDK